MPFPYRFKLTLITTSLFLAPLNLQSAELPSLLSPAAASLRLKNYSAAAKLAAESPEGGARNLLLGYAYLKSGRFDEAAGLLAKSGAAYHLLADYAYFYQAEALRKGGKSAEGARVFLDIARKYPDSPLARKSTASGADLLFESADYVTAETEYRKFVEKYASGADAIQATYRIGVCREKSGDAASALAVYRSLWLNSPASPQGQWAEEGMKRLASEGKGISPYTNQELFKRAGLLYDQRRFEMAAEAYRSINIKAEKQEFAEKVRLKIGQSLLKARSYSAAETALKQFATSDAKPALRAEAAHLAAKAIERGGRDEEAFAAYNQVASQFPDSPVADDALLDAAFVRKFQYRPKEASALLVKLLEVYPESSQKNRINWELGWAHYLAGDFAVASMQFKKIQKVDEYRERALYWQSRSAASTGDRASGIESLGQLAREFPYGFYNLSIKGEALEGPPRLKGDEAAISPLPAGYERVKGLIFLGLTEDANGELAVARKKGVKGRGDAALARLYTETGNYNGAMSLFNPSMLNSTEEGKLAWGMLYPKAFGDLVVKYSARAGVDPALAFAVMRAESAFTRTAISPVGARGLMQLMPATAAEVMGVKKVEPESLYDAELNIRLGTKHLRELIDKFGGNRIAVIASYNAGAHNVNRWLKTYATLKEEEFVESIPFAETREYVKKVLAVQALYKKLYGI